MRILLFLFLICATLSLPFFLHNGQRMGSYDPSTPTIVIITPQNSAIRDEFSAGFSKWHEKKYGTPVVIDWRVTGGATEIMRYLESEYTAAKKRGKPSENISVGIDLLYGGGEYNHSYAERTGLTEPVWPKGREPQGVVADEYGKRKFPETLGGATLQSENFFAVVLSSFGICRNVDRLNDLKIDNPPSSWEDLADEKLFGAIGLADPTKSGSVAKAFEIIVYSQMMKNAIASGYQPDEIRRIEAAVAAGQKAPDGYERTLDEGWRKGIWLLQDIGANAKYFTASSDKIPADVANGLTAAGVCIDFYGRAQAAQSIRADGRTSMEFSVPLGEAGVTADTVSILKGAPHRKLAERFVEYSLSEAGQKLWYLPPGSPEGPEKHALGRMPVLEALYDENVNTPQPASNAYLLARKFDYFPRWTMRQFAPLRDLFRAMCMDSGRELRKARAAIIKNEAAKQNPKAVKHLRKMPFEPFTRAGLSNEASNKPRQKLLQQWTEFFRCNYRIAAKSAECD